jgi:hypothetical protein
VNVRVDRGDAAGGLIRINERVEVYLTTRITDTQNTNISELRSAPIDLYARVVAKRDNPSIVLAPNVEEKISYTLETNPYRAALIEYAAKRGTISLRPVAGKQKWEPKRPDPKTGKADNTMGMGMLMYDAESKEYSGESDRITRIRRGDYSISDIDLARIFGLSQKVYPPEPIRIRTWEGTKNKGDQYFDTSGSVTSAPPGGNTRPLAVSFNDPSVKSKDCPSCGK